MKSIYDKRRAAAVALLLAAGSGPAWAQSVPPGGGVPTRDQVTRPVAPPANPPTRLRVSGTVEAAPCPLADPAYKDIRVTLTSVSFGNLKGVAPAELEPIYRNYLGQGRPVSVICEIRDAVATTLRGRGFLAAVQVPTQQIENGAVRFEVLYARLTAIRVRGDAGRLERLIQSYLEKLTHDDVFNQREAERYLLLVRDLPGLDVRLALKPAGAPGEVYGEVTLVRTPVEADLNIQNLGPSDTGRLGGQARLQLNGLTGLGDQTTLAFFSTAEFREQQVLQLGHEMRLGGEGLRLSGRFTYAWTRPDLAPAADLLRARTLFATGEARYPLLRSQAITLWGASGFDFVNQTVRFDTTRIAEDRLRVAYFRIDGDATDRINAVPVWRTSYDLELRQGLSVFDATRLPRTGAVAPTRADGDVHGTLVRGSLQTELAVTPRVSFATVLRAQYAFDPLFAFEEFSAGTYTIGRGYDPGTLVGDDGVGISGELRINRIAPFGPGVALQPFAFLDAARVWNKHGGGNDDLLSLGGGVRASFRSLFRLDLTVAVPTRAAGFQTRTLPARVLASFTTKLWPWGNAR